MINILCIIFNKELLEALACDQFIWTMGL